MQPAFGSADDTDNEKRDDADSKKNEDTDNEKNEDTDSETEINDNESNGMRRIETQQAQPAPRQAQPAPGRARQLGERHDTRSYRFCVLYLLKWGRFLPVLNWDGAWPG